MRYTNYGPRGQQTPQNEPIPGKPMVPNAAGGFGFLLDDMARLRRFLVLGTEGGSYYATERQLTKENLAVVERLVSAGRGCDVVDAIIEVSQAGRAAKNDQALFALAYCTSAQDVTVRRKALMALHIVARTGTHLLHFAPYAKQFRGWGRAFRRAVANWYNLQPEDRLAFQLLKYQSRDGYSQRDLLRLAHPKTTNGTRNALYHWATKGWPGVGEDPHPEEALRQIWAFEKAKKATEVSQVVDLIKEYKLPREAVPTEWLKEAAVWAALLEDMPPEATMRNLATMTRIGLLRPMASPTQKVMVRLADAEAIKRARLHPFKILSAILTYSQGKSLRGTSTWTPLQEIVDVLNLAFYLSFGNIEATGKRFLIAVDVSGSMWQNRVNEAEENRQGKWPNNEARHDGKKESHWTNQFPGFSCAQGAAALALVTAAVEPHTHIIGFESQVYPLPISPKQRLDDVMETMRRVCHPRGTDCSLPFRYAMEQKLDVDVVLSLSDGETWQGTRFPTQELAAYRQQVGHSVKAINIQMTASHTSNFDPTDSDVLEVVGFDTAAFDVIHNFISGAIDNH